MADTPLDRRLHAYRDDLADEALRGQLAAERFAAGEMAQVMRGVVPLRGRPDWTAGLDNEVLYGERVRVFEVRDGWAWVQLARDGYVGYVPADAVSRPVMEPTHRVKALGTFLYPAADIKTPPLMGLSLGADLAVLEEGERFARLASGAFVIARHIAPVGATLRDYVAVAERFIGVPYLWGGRSRFGLDCSGLVQLSLEAAGQRAPRDSDLQQAALGTAIALPESREGLQRGDLVFWPGHVAIMVDDALIIHANAHHMAVAVEPLKGAAERIAKTGTAIAAVKRLGPPA